MVVAVCDRNSVCVWLCGLCVLCVHMVFVGYVYIVLEAMYLICMDPWIHVCNVCVYVYMVLFCVCFVHI